PRRRLRHRLVRPLDVVGKRGTRLRAQLVRAHRIDELRRRRAGERDPALAQRPAHERLVAVRVPPRLDRAVVEVEPLVVRLPPQLRTRRIRALEVLAPLDLAAEETLVHGLQLRLLAFVGVALDDAEKVDIAPLVAGAERERAVQVRADERVAEDALLLGDQLAQELVELRKRGQRGTGRASCDSTSATASATASSISCSSTSSGDSVGRWYSSYGKWRIEIAGTLRSANQCESTPPCDCAASSS